MLFGHSPNWLSNARPWFVAEQLEPRVLLSAEYAITDLGMLGGGSSFAFAVNQALEVAGRSLESDSPITERAFVWDAENAMRDLGVLGGFTSSVATGINDATDVVGTSLNATFDERAFLLNGGVVDAQQSPAAAPLLDLGSLAGTWSRAAAINNAGQVVGTTAIEPDPSDDGGPFNQAFHAFLWADGVMLDLGTLGGDASLAKGISDDGIIVGVSFPAESEVFHAFVWADGVMTDLGTLGGPGSSANDVNDAGFVVGDADHRRRDASGFHRFHAAAWQQGRVTNLGTLGGLFSSALAVSNGGQIVGWSETRQKDAAGRRVEHAFIYENGRMSDLNNLIDDDQWTLTRATAINDDGYVVGYGTYRGDEIRSAETHAFILRPLYPDLVVEITQVGLPEGIVPGDRGTISVVVTNQGENDARGRGTIEIFATPDQATGGDELLLAQLVQRRIKLRPGQSTTMRFRFIVPPQTSPGAYHFTARFATVSGIQESDASNNMNVTPGTHEVVWMFGQLRNRRRASLTVKDTFGDTFRFAIRGAGFGQVQSGTDGLDIVVNDTNDRSTVAMVGIGRNDQTAVHDVTINGSLNELRADGIDLRGDLISTDTVGRIRFDDVETQSLVMIGSDGAGTDKVDLYFDQVHDLSVISQVRIGMIHASTWQGLDATPDVIDAPALDRLIIGRRRGRRGSGSAVEMNANLVLSGAGVDVSRLTLGHVAIAGGIGGGQWFVAGHVGAVRADHVDRSWQGDFLGRVRKLRIERDFSGRLSAESMGILDVGHNVRDALLSLGPTTSSTMALDKMRVGLRVERTTVRAAGNIGDISIGAAEDVDLFAGVRPDAMALPVTVGDFDAMATIAKLTIRGIPGQSSSSVTNAKIAAWSIGSIEVARAAPANPARQALSPTPAGPNLAVASHTIGTLTYASGSGTIRLKRPDEFLAVPGGELLVRII